MEDEKISDPTQREVCVRLKRSTETIPYVESSRLYSAMSAYMFLYFDILTIYEARGYNDRVLKC